MSSSYGRPDLPPQQIYPPPQPPQLHSSMPPPQQTYQHHQQSQHGHSAHPHNDHRQTQHQTLPNIHGMHSSMDQAPHSRHPPPPHPHAMPHHLPNAHPQMHLPSHHSNVDSVRGPHPGPNAGPVSHEQGAQVSGSSLARFSKVDEAAGRKYILEVVQQPKRARMCGFGDKDRRPITPPPCVRLVILDIMTGKEVDISDLDPLTFVLNVDLWDEAGSREVNLVRSATGGGSPSAHNGGPNLPTYSYGTTNSTEMSHGQYQPQHPLPPSREGGYNPPPQVAYPADYPLQSAYSQPSPQYNNPAYPSGPGYYPQAQYRQDSGPVPSYSRASSAAPSNYPTYSSSARSSLLSSQPQGMSSRNLIGSVAVSAFRLADTENRIGIWFVLQDLSVRVEGPFRLRFSAVNVARTNKTPRDGSNPQVNTGRVPLLASGFSDVFTVYSAKKFPGVCESTPLSKRFAVQGVKIPIRKDGASKGEDDDYYGE